MSEAAERIDAFMLKHGLAVQSAFIPLSKSRNAPDPKAADKDKRVHESIRVTEFLSSGEAVDFWVAHSDDGND